MAKLILTDAELIVNAVDLSAWVASVEVQTNVDDVDLTTMGAVSHQHGQGLRDDRITVTFVQDFALSAVDATLWPLFSAGSSFTMSVKAVKGTATSTTNPKYNMTAQLMAYSPLAGSVGARSDIPVTFMPSGSSAGITKQTT